jgi:hypothetical protein
MTLLHVHVELSALECVGITKHYCLDVYLSSHMSMYTWPRHIAGHCDYTLGKVMHIPRSRPEHAIIICGTNPGYIHDHEI